MEQTGVPKRRHTKLTSGKSPKRKNITFKTRRKFEIKKEHALVLVACGAAAAAAALQFQELRLIT